MEHEYKEWKKTNSTKLAIALLEDKKKFYGLTLNINMEHFEIEVRKFVMDLLKDKENVATTEVQKYVDKKG